MATDCLPCACPDGHIHCAAQGWPQIAFPVPVQTGISGMQTDAGPRPWQMAESALQIGTTNWAAVLWTAVTGCMELQEWSVKLAGSSPESTPLSFP